VPRHSRFHTVSKGMDPSEQDTSSRFSCEGTGRGRWMTKQKPGDAPHPPGGRQRAGYDRCASCCYAQTPELVRLSGRSEMRRRREKATSRSVAHTERVVNWSLSGQVRWPSCVFPRNAAYYTTPSLLCQAILSGIFQIASHGFIEPQSGVKRHIIRREQRATF
jgi:hypothetical protein